MEVCTSLQTDNHANTPPLKFFTGRMPFLLPNQQRQSTEGTFLLIQSIKIKYAKSKQKYAKLLAELVIKWYSSRT